MQKPSPDGDEVSAPKRSELWSSNFFGDCELWIVSVEKTSVSHFADGKLESVECYIRHESYLRGSESDDLI